MPQVVSIRHFDQLDQVYLPWSNLLRQTPAASYIESLDFLRSTLHGAAAAQQLRVLVVSSRGAVIGLLPLALLPQSNSAGRVLAYAPHHRARPARPLGPNPAATLYAALGHLWQQTRDWDELCLDSEQASRMRVAMQMTGRGFEETVCGATHVVALDGDWKQFIAARPGDLQTRLRRAEAQLATQGELTYHRYRPGGAACGDDDTRSDLLAECAALPAVESTNPAPCFDVHRQAVKCGAADLNVLRLGGRAIACCYAFHYQGRTDLWTLGCDPRQAAQNALCVLIARMLKDSFGRGDSMLCLAGEPAPTLQGWITSSSQRNRFVCRNRVRFRSQLIRALRWARGSAPDSAAEQAGL